MGEDMLFKRDPALILTALATAVRLASAFWLDWTIGQQALVNAFLAAASGLVVAFVVRHDGQVAAIVGVITAMIALAVGFGLRMSPENQALIMSLVGAVAAAFTRTQVESAVSATGVERPPVTVVRTGTP